MQEIIYNEGVISYLGKDYPYEGFDLIDSHSVHLSLGGWMVCFVISQTTINGEFFDTVEDFLSKFQ